MGRKFTEIDEEFICENCGKLVKPLGYSCRNHCNYCLHSKHVDINPGDREEQCHGILEPISVELDSKKGYVIICVCCSFCICCFYFYCYTVCCFICYF